MEIINLPVGIKLVDEKGYMTQEYVNFFSRFFQIAQQNLSNDGYKVPVRPRSEILGDLDNSKQLGNLLYGDDNQLVININGVFKKVDTSVY